MVPKSWRFLSRRSPARPEWLLLALLGCEAAPTPRIDLDGPRGGATPPGPWPIRAYAEGAPATLWVAVGEGAFERVAAALDAQGAVVGLLPDAPPGTRLRYYAEVEGHQVPPADEARTVVIQPARAPDAPAPPADCRLAFRWPTAGLVLTPEEDDAPQAGVQITVIVDTNLADGAPARLDVSGRGYSAAARASTLAFSGVTLTPGPVVLVAEATPDGGRPCDARIAVEHR